MMIRGVLDEVSPREAAGWVFSPDAGDRLVVQVLLGAEIIGEAVADGYRADLSAVGVGDGKCGFQIRFRREIDPTFLPFVTAKPEGCDLELPRWHPRGLVEYFGSVFRGGPAAGWHRNYDEGEQALRLVVEPARGMPAQLAEGTRQLTEIAKGVRCWL